MPKYGHELSPQAGSWVGWPCQKFWLLWLPELWNWAFGAIPLYRELGLGGGGQTGIPGLCKGEQESQLKRTWETMTLSGKGG